MRIIIFILILLALDVYAFQAFKIVAQDWSAWAKNLLYALYWAIPVLASGMLFLAAYGDISAWDKNLISVLRAIVFVAYFSKLLVAGVLLIDDVRRLFGGVFDSVAGQSNFEAGRSRFLATLAVIIGSIPFISLTYGIIRNRYRYKVFSEKVPIKGLPKALEGLRIVQISDVHSGSFGLKEPVKNGIQMINDLKADLVFFTGDLVNNVAVEMEHFKDVFDKITAKYGVYSVLGNHDYGDYVRWESREDKRRNLENLINTHREMGWDILLNENRLLNINGEQVAVLGVENYSAHPRFPKYGDLAAAHQGTENAALKLLLSHDPSHWKDQVTTLFQDIAITFSGHTHGMQFGIEIPGWLKWSPVQYVYKQWAGLYQEGQQFLYVNRGFGFLGYPGRVGILPEITLLELEAA